jgi:hypothetical protein
MKNHAWTMTRWTVWVVLAVVSGCQGSPSGDAKLDGNFMQDMLLEDEPPGARGVMDVKSELQNREDPGNWTDVVLVARIGGIEGETWDPKRAAFMVVDQSVVESEATHESPQHDADNCPFCRANRKKLLASTALVQIVDSSGQVPSMHARKLLGVEEGQTIVLQGKGRIDGLGNLAVRATGVFVPGKGAGL